MPTIDKAHLEKIGLIQNEYMKRRFSTKNSQYNYDIVHLRFLNSIAHAMLFFYFFLGAIYLGILFIGQNKDKTSYFYKISVLLIIVGLPFLITPIEYVLFRGTQFVVETVIGKVFEIDDYGYILDQTYVPNFLSSKF